MTRDKKKRSINIISHVNTNHSNNFKSYNIDYVESRKISSSSTLEYGSSSITMFNNPTRIDIYPNVCINKEMPGLYDINEDNYAYIYILEEIVSERDDSDMNSYHYQVDVYITPIDSTNDTTCSYQNQDVNINRNFNAPS